jgi:hypothetical protein
MVWVIDEEGEEGGKRKAEKGKSSLAATGENGVESLSW